MFDLGWSELFVIALVALVVVGPKDLPRVLRTVTQTLGKIKGMAREFQSGLDEMARETELSDLKKEIDKASRGSLDKAFEETVDPTGDVGRSIREIKASVEKGPAEVSTPAPQSSSTAAAADEDISPLEQKYKSIGQAFEKPADGGDGKAAS